MAPGKACVGSRSTTPRLRTSTAVSERWQSSRSADRIAAWSSASSSGRDASHRLARGLDADHRKRDGQHGDLGAQSFTEIGAPGGEGTRGEVAPDGPGVRGPVRRHPREVGLGEADRGVGPFQILRHRGRGSLRTAAGRSSSGIRHREAGRPSPAAAAVACAAWSSSVIGSGRPSANRLGRAGDPAEGVLCAQAVGIQRANGVSLPAPARPRVHRHAGAKKRRNRVPGVESVVLASVSDARRVGDDVEPGDVGPEERPRRRRAEVREGDASRIRFEQRHAGKVAARRRQSAVPQPLLNPAEAAAGPVERRAGAARQRHEHRRSPLRQLARRAQGGARARWRAPGWRPQLPSRPGWASRPCSRPRNGGTRSPHGG